MGDVKMIKEGFDMAKLVEEVAIIENEVKYNKRGLDVDKIPISYKGICGWKVIGLRTINGDISERGTILQRIENKEFKNTPIMNKCPYIHQILTELTPNGINDVMLVRLMKLDHHGYISPHNDGTVFRNLEQMVRCHLPIITHPDVKMKIENTEYHLEAGKLWFTRVDKMHSVKNDSDIDRVHLVIDFKPTPDMLT